MSKPTILTSFVLLAAVLLGACAQTKPAAASTRAASAADASAVRAVPRYDAATFFETESVAGAGFSADEERILYSSDRSGVFNVYSQPIAGGEPKALTRSTTNATTLVAPFPEDDRVIVTADVGGNELNHLYVLETDGTLKDVTPGEKLKAVFVKFSKDHGSFFAVTNERDARFFDLYRYSAKGPDYARELVFKNDDNFNISEVSTDGRWVALGKSRNNADSDIFVWDSKTPDAAPRRLTPHEGDALFMTADVTPDNRTLVVLTDEGGEFMRAWSYDLASGERALLVSAPWDVVGVAYSDDGRYRATWINADGRTEVSLVETAGGKPVAMPSVPRGQIRGVTFSRSGKRLAFLADGDTSPGDLHVLDLEKGQSKRLTRTLTPKIEEDALVESEVVRFPSFDGVKVPALLYKPKQASASRKAPAVLLIHGGPGGQTTVGYSSNTQFLVNQGYAILAVNNRGSSGYGKTFFHMDDKKHGDVDLKDCVWARKYLESLDWVDGSRVGIMGGSYGGYMVAAALAFTPEVFDVGIDIFGVTNWLRTLQSIPAWWEQQRQALYAELGDPKTDEEALKAKSPLFHADKIRRPLLVVQGKNDPRVLQVESDEIVAAAKKNGVPVEYLVFDDEGHGFRKKANRITAAEAYRAFLDRYLVGGAARP